jgi:ricin-type beta-trefoil lectin protein
VINMASRFSRLLAGVMAAALALPTAPADAQATSTTAAGPRYRIFNTEGRCLDGNNPNGLYIWQCVNATNQYWYFDFEGTTWARIRNVKTGRCIDPTYLDGPMITRSCDNVALWYGQPVPNTPGWHWVQPHWAGGMCINGPSSSNGSGLLLNICGSQQWPTDIWSWVAV